MAKGSLKQDEIEAIKYAADLVHTAAERPVSPTRPESASTGASWRPWRRVLVRKRRRRARPLDAPRIS